MAASRPALSSTGKSLRDRLICLAVGLAWLALIGAAGGAGLTYLHAKRDPHFTQKMQMRVVLAECLRAKINAARGIPRAEITTRCAKLVQHIQEQVGSVR
jgi:hypothetical protein